MSTIDQLVKQLELYDDAYHNGDSLVPDAIYDDLKLQAQKLKPNHPYFMQVGSDTRGGKIKLPFTMGSLDQIYTADPSLYNFTKWSGKYKLAKESIVISHKLDGISCMLQFKNGELQIAYSRGNGVMGADITRHVKKIKNIPKSIAGTGHLTIRGELIMSDEKFAQNWAKEFANPRNMVAGMFNRSTSDEDALADVDFIAYQTVDASTEYLSGSQVDDLIKLADLGFTIVNSEVVTGGDLSDTILTEKLIKARARSPYALDGIVLTIDAKNSQKTISNSSSLNPEHSVKFKVLDADATKETKVVKVHYEISKWGRQKPRVEIVPVKIGGVTVTYATGFNGKFIEDNQIGPGKTIKLVRSGEVIPYITHVVPDDIKAEYPAGKWVWDENEVEFVIEDYQNHPAVIFKQVLSFFQTLDVDLLKEASLERVYSSLKLSYVPFETAISTILSLIELEWVNIIGSNGSKIFASLERRLGSLQLATYLGAVNHFGSGFGVRKAKLLLKNLHDENDVWNLSTGEVAGFEGFDVKTAGNFVKGLHAAKKLVDDLNLTFAKEVKTNELAHLSVVFTGFRDKEFQDKLEKAGAKVGSSVSKKTTHLITAEPNSTSTKAKKAREMGVETLSLDEFKDKYNV